MPLLLHGVPYVLAPAAALPCPPSLHATPYSPALQLWRVAAELVELVLSEYTLQLSGGHKEARPTLDEEFHKESRQLIEPFGESECGHRCPSLSLPLPQPLTSEQREVTLVLLILSSSGQPVQTGNWSG